MRRAFFGLLFALVGTCVALILSGSAAGASTDVTDGLEQSQTGQNSNTTDQQSDATATTKQLNLNLPISLVSPGSNSGDVEQSNDADTTVISANENDSKQSVDQIQQGSVEGSDKGHDSCGCGHESKNGPDGNPSVSQNQQAANTNETSQDSSAEATTKQANVNLPIAILSPGANSGDVDQSNKADTYVVSYNQNESDQSVDQTQQGSVEGSDKGGNGCERDKCGHSKCAPSYSGKNGCHDNDKGHGQDKGRCGCDHGGNSHLSQSQQAANTNETTQNSSAEATTKQANVNMPISILGFGLHDRGGKDDYSKGPYSMEKGRCGCDRPNGSDHGKSGDVDQSNQADTYVASVNSNDSWQWIDQLQQGWVKG